MTKKRARPIIDSSEARPSPWQESCFDILLVWTDYLNAAESDLPSAQPKGGGGTLNRVPCHWVPLRENPESTSLETVGYCNRRRAWWRNLGSNEHGRIFWRRVRRALLWGRHYASMVPTSSAPTPSEKQKTCPVEPALYRIRCLPWRPPRSSRRWSFFCRGATPTLPGLGRNDTFCQRNETPSPLPEVYSRTQENELETVTHLCSPSPSAQEVPTTTEQQVPKDACSLVARERATSQSLSAEHANIQRDSPASRATQR